MSKVAVEATIPQHQHANAALRVNQFDNAAMTHRQLTYTVAALLLATAFACLLVAHDSSELLRNLAGVPLVAAVVASFVQLARDDAAHTRTLLGMDHQNRFVLGASSHMANVAFDKHAAFCEEYVNAVHAALHTLFREGPSDKVLPDAGTLHAVQQKYAVWITTQIQKDLEPFQSALREIGASAWFVEATRGDEHSAEERQQHINSMFSTLAKVMGFTEWESQPVTSELAAAAVVGRLRSILGTEELSQMRRVIVERAMGELGSAH